jgi:LuxR family transcriptional regulator, maltose regulon positive regulatory protein
MEQAQHRSGSLPSRSAQITSRAPRIRSDWLMRARLLDQLDAGNASALVLLTAPAGFGKTTLLAQWAAHTHLPVAWVPARGLRASPRAFFTLVVEAIRSVTADASAVADTVHLLRQGGRAPYRYIATTLLRELSALPEELALIVDDYHLVSHEAIHQFIADLAQEHLPTIHLILSSRSDPLVSLERVRAGADVTEMRASALQFTPAEVEAFLIPHLGVEESQHIAVEVAKRTEGWIAGLRLAILSLKSNPRPDEFLARLKASGGHHVMGYLVSEALSQQSPETQTFLLRTSVLEQLNGDLCDAVVGSSEAKERGRAALERLERLNLFITRLDDRGEWFRYHALFQELLQHELLAREGQAAVFSLHQRASEWYAHRGMIDEALAHALKTSDEVVVTRLVERNIERALNEQRWRDLERWLKLLPDAVIQHRPALLIALATVHSIRERLRAIPTLLRRAEDLMAAQSELSEALSDTVLRGMCAVLWAQDHYWRNEGPEGLRAVKRAIEALPAGSTFARGSALMYAGLLGQLTGDGAAADMLEALVDTDESAAVTARALLSLCLISRQAGDLDKCEASAKRLLTYAENQRLVLDMNWAHYFLGWVAYERNNLDEARNHLLFVSEHRYFANAISASDSLITLALTYQAQGRLTEADETLQDLNEYATELNHSSAMAAVAGLRSRLALARGDLQTTLAMYPWLNSPSSAPTPMVWLLPPSLTRAHISLAQGAEEHLRQAIAQLADLEAFARSTHDPWRLYTIHGLQAIARYELGQSDASLSLLRQTLAAAQSQRFVRTFADCGPKMAYLLRQIRLQGLAPQMARYVDEILEACASPHPPAHSPPDEMNDGQVQGASSLTAREIQVLLMLEQRYSDKEIADALVISSFTVRAHTRNIYRKLDVSDRRGAASKAREMGVLGSGLSAL